MNTRRTTLALGAAAGGLMAATFLSTAVAFAQTDPVTPVLPTADVFGFTPSALGESITGSNGIAPLFQDTLGLEQFTTAGTATGVTPELGAGTFNADVSTYTFLGGASNTEITVASVEGLGTTAPPVGSVFDTSTLAGFTNVYTDVANATGTGAGTVTDTLETPFGNLDLTSLVSSFDPSATLSGDQFAFLGLDNPEFITAADTFLTDLGTVAPTLVTPLEDLLEPIVTNLGIPLVF